MNLSDLDAFFNPNSIAVIGASDEEGSVGYRIMKNLTSQGYEGKVFPVNLRKKEIAGLKAYKSVGKIPGDVELAIIATPAKTVPGIVKQCGEKGIHTVLIISAGFKEIGKKGKELENQIRSVIEEYRIRVVGPNCLGVIRPSKNLNAKSRS